MRLFTSTKISEQFLGQSIFKSKKSFDVDYEELFPLDLYLMGHEQQEDINSQKLLKQEKVQASDKSNSTSNIKEQAINDVEVVTFRERIYIPSSVQEDILHW